MIFVLFPYLRVHFSTPVPLCHDVCTGDYPYNSSYFTLTKLVFSLFEKKSSLFETNIIDVGTDSIKIFLRLRMDQIFS